MKSDGYLLLNARSLRKARTAAELLLWRHLRNCQVEGVKFKQQQPIENYIVDFVAFAPKLVIELDGSQHMDNKHYDEARDACLRKNGFTVLRFWNNELVENIEGVLEVIRLRCLRSASPSPRPSPARGEGELW
jgi:very-short-patch-repair endonuclease